MKLSLLGFLAARVDKRVAALTPSRAERPRSVQNVDNLLKKI